MQALGGGEFAGMFEGRLEVVAGLDQACGQGDHSAVLLDGIAVRHDDRGGDADTRGGKGDRLAVVTPGRGADACGIGRALPEARHVDDAAADLEGADRGVVLVLDGDIGAAARREQGPAAQRRRRHHLMDHRLGAA